MSNLPREHHHLNAHARHLEKALTALLWTVRFRWTATLVIDRLLGGNGLVRKLIARKFLVEHRVPSPFSPVRYYVTLGLEGLALLQRNWQAIEGGAYGHLALCLSRSFELPIRPDHRIREHRFEHDLHLQFLVTDEFRREGLRLQYLQLSDDLERTPPAKRPSKIPDAILHLRSKDDPTDPTISTRWIEVEYSRKNSREVDTFCAYYRAALVGSAKKPFDELIIYCHASLYAQWRRDFLRTTIPKWIFRKDKRTWVRLDPKDWLHFPELTFMDRFKYVQQLPADGKKSSAAQAPARDALAASGQRSG